MTDTVSPALARRIALAAQGFASTRSAATPGTQALRAMVDRLGLLQIDSVNVFERSHYLPALSRLGDYERTALDRLAHGKKGRFVEYWAHQAAFVPRETWPLFGFRRRAYLYESAQPDSWLSTHRDLADWLLAELRDQGPLRAGVIEHDANRSRGSWWGWSDVKLALELMWRTGQVVCTERVRFERVYALPEHAFDGNIVDLPEDESIRRLVAHAASALGIATEADLADYYRMKRAQVRGAIRDLEDGGILRPVRVPGWESNGREIPTWVHHQARRPRRIDAAALLSPFDPVVWFRPRTERLFDFHYRIEIYTPAHKRKFGYYSLPILVGDQVVGRVDLKSDRKPGILRVQSAWQEPGAPDDTAERLVPVLREAAAWQGLTDIHVGGWGNLAAPLRAELRQSV